MIVAEALVPPSAGRHVAAVLDRLCPMLLEAEAEFNALDRAIGDGDHGSNLSRAAHALADLREELALLPPGEALSRAGKAIVMSVGGASGPLYGTLLMETGKALPGGASLADWSAALTAGVEAVARRGRSQEGDKTMIDVLAPAARAFADAVPAGIEAALTAMLSAAQAGLAAQRALLARRGRAAYVGQRSVGADDPGATSALRCLTVVVDFCATVTR